MLKQVSAEGYVPPIDSDLPLFLQIPNWCVCHFDRSPEVLNCGDYRGYFHRRLQRYELCCVLLLSAGNRPTLLVR